MSAFTDQLESLNACRDAVRWVGERDLPTAWMQCERGDWMLWLAAKVKIDRKLVVLAACDCAELAWPYVKRAETLQAAKSCVKVTREWCEGRADIEDVRKARAYAAADYAAYAAADYAAYAAAAAAYAAAAADAADAADAAAARAKVLSECATLVRARISVETIVNAMKEAA